MVAFWKGTSTRWSVFSIVLHWASALVVFSLYALGWYMVELDYYDTWYKTAPFWHKSVGLALFILILFRLINKACTASVTPLASHARWEVRAAQAAHISLYILIFVCCFSGYLISTADGRGISFFGWFDVPAWVIGIENQEDVAGLVHEWSTNALVILAVLHALAALKHHFIDRDKTLLRMMGRSER